MKIAGMSAPATGGRAPTAAVIDEPGLHAGPDAASAAHGALRGAPR